MTRTKKTKAPAKTKEIGLGFITELDRYLFGQGTHYKIFENSVLIRKHIKEKAACILPSGLRTQKRSAL